MLDRSHRKLEDSLNELYATAVAIADGVATEDELSIVRDIASFLERSVTRHEADEEESLFPRLRGQAGIDPVLDTLIDDHREHNRLHRRLREIADSWLDGQPTPEHAQHLLRVVVDIQDAYRRHIDLEETRLFPLARELGAAELAAIGDEMQARRGR